MKAVRFHEFGGLDVLRVEEVDDPRPGPGEVLVRIRASALNHLDVDIREGVSRFPVELPHTLGVEVAGDIAGARRRRRGLGGRATASTRTSWTPAASAGTAAPAASRSA